LCSDMVRWAARKNPDMQQAPRTPPRGAPAMAIRSKHVDTDEQRKGGGNGCVCGRGGAAHCSPLRAANRWPTKHVGVRTKPEPMLSGRTISPSGMNFMLSGLGVGSIFTMIPRKAAVAPRRPGRPTAQQPPRARGRNNMWKSQKSEVSSPPRFVNVLVRVRGWQGETVSSGWQVTVARGRQPQSGCRREEGWWWGRRPGSGK
jgi:hypothetical protein